MVGITTGKYMTFSKPANNNQYESTTLRSHLEEDKKQIFLEVINWINCLSQKNSQISEKYHCQKN
jgi:hypothetical protein